MLWVKATIKDLQTQKIERADDCGMAKLPILLIELLRNTNGVQAAVESSRNENVKWQDDLLGLLKTAAIISAQRQLQDSEN